MSSLSSLSNLITIPNLASHSPPSLNRNQITSNTTTPIATNINTVNNGGPLNSSASSSMALSSASNNNKSGHNKTNNQLVTQQQQQLNNNNTNEDLEGVQATQSQEEEISPIISFGKQSYQTPTRQVEEEDGETTPEQELSEVVFDESDDDVVFLGSQPPPCFTNSIPSNQSSSSDSDSDDVSQVTPTKLTNRKRRTPNSAPTLAPPNYYSSSSDDDRVSDLEMDSVLTFRTEASQASQPAPKKRKKTEKVTRSSAIVAKLEQLRRKKRNSHPTSSSARRLDSNQLQLQQKLEMQNQPHAIGVHPQQLHNPVEMHFRPLSFPQQHQFGASASTVGPSFSMISSENIVHSQIHHSLPPQLAQFQMPPPSLPMHNMISHEQNQFPPSLVQPTVEQPTESAQWLANVGQEMRTSEASSSVSTVQQNSNAVTVKEASSSNGVVKPENRTIALVTFIKTFARFEKDNVLLRKIFDSMQGKSIDEMCNEDVDFLILSNTTRKDDKTVAKEWDKRLKTKSMGKQWKQLVEDYPE